MEVSNKTLDEQAKEIAEQPSIPIGYMTMELSTKGKFGAPKTFHVRNFKTEDLVGLAIEDDDKMQEAAADMLQSLIFEKDVDVKKFHQKEVVETFLRLYRRYYQNVLKNLPWELTEEDKEIIAKEEGGKDTDAYRRRLAAIKRGDEKQFFDIDLKQVDYYEIPENVTGTVRVTQKDPETGKDFIVEYTYPRYGDAILLKKFIMNIPEIKEGERRFASITENVKFRQKMENAWKEGENVPLERIPRFTQQDMEAFYEFQKKKARFATRAVKALHLKSIDGVDISDLPLDKKLAYADDPRLDHATFEQVNKLYEDMKIGPIEDVKVVDPYTKKVTKIHYTFRLFTILQTIRDNKPDGTVIEFV